MSDEEFVARIRADKGILQARVIPRAKSWIHVEIHDIWRLLALAEECLKRRKEAER